MNPLTHPALILFAAALLCALLPLRWTKRLIPVGALLALFVTSRQDTGSFPWFTIGQGTAQIKIDELSFVFSLVFCIVTFIGLIYAQHVTRRFEHVAALVYAGGALGVVMAADWASLFMFWELMAVASLFVIWFGGKKSSDRAGYRYLLVHITGGSLLFAGVLIHVSQSGSMAVAALTPTGASGEGASPLAFWLILTGVAVNAAIPPLHAWLADSYPEASISGSVFLSAFTTKTAVYVLIRLFPGATVLLWAGVVMALYGVVYAVLENNIRRLLAYHIISQVGYMVAAVGIGTALSLNGATAHAFSHILYKSLLFMGVGAVIFATGKEKLTELGGIGGRMKATVLLYGIGAVSISGFPLFNGFISKSMIISAAAEGHLPVAELALTLASVGTFLHTGLKLPYFTFGGPEKPTPVKPVPAHMLVAMGIGATLCTLFGVAPGLLYQWLPFEATYHPYSLDHLVSTSQLLVGTALAFWLMLPKLQGEATESMDTDWFYRRPLARLLGAGIGAAASFGQWVSRLRRALVTALTKRLYRPMPTLIEFLDAEPGETYDRNRFHLPIGYTVFWVLVYFALLATTSWWLGGYLLARN